MVGRLGDSSVAMKYLALLLLALLGPCHGEFSDGLKMPSRDSDERFRDGGTIGKIIQNEAIRDLDVIHGGESEPKEYVGVNCVDKDDKCQERADKNECQTNFRYMGPNCPKTCGL